MKYSGVAIGDIHFGVMDGKELYHQLKEVFLYNLSNMEKLDFIFILGDYFDSKLYMNTDHAKYAIDTMSEIISMARNKESVVKIRVLEGTKSHDNDQLKMFDMYVNDSTLDFKIIYHVEREELFTNFNVLYLPEELIKSKSDYYKEYMSDEDEYDLILGHGVISDVMTYMKEDTSTDRFKTPIFTFGELDMCCKGLTFFAHYHNRVNLKDKVFYLGSFSRWQHGEEGDKGFCIINVNTDKSKYEYKFINNWLAKSYQTFYYGFDSYIFKDKDSFFKEFNYMEKLISDNDFDFIRLIVNIPDNFPEPEFIIKYLNDKFSSNKRISLELTHGYVDKAKELAKKKIEDMENEYGFALDKSLPLSHKIKLFIEKRFDKNMKVEKIEHYLYEE